MASTKTSNKMKIKMNIAMGLMIVLGFGILIYRLYVLQIAEGEFYRSKALAQQLRPTTIAPQRGSIYDRNRKTLAASADVWTVTISPAELENEKQLNQIADFLAPLLELDRDKIIQRGQKKGSYYEVLKARVEEEVASQITAFTIENKIGCVNLIKSTKRYYPYGDLASTILGFTDNDGKGAYGLESHYNKALSGTPGMVVSAKNAKSGNMPFSYDKMYESVDGNSLVLTIDEVIQHSLEKHLETAVIEHNVKNRAVGIAMDVNTGAILGMASKPDFDPNDPTVLEDPDAIARMAAFAVTPEQQAELDGIADSAEREKRSAAMKQEALQKEWYSQWRNKAVSDPYEPGSVFKIITAAMALDTGSATPTGQTYHCPGFHIVAGRRKACWNARGHGTIDFIHAIKFSCNPAFMMIGAKIGALQFYDYFERFGLREATGVDLPGEAEGIFYNLSTLSKESGEELASSAFGQTFTVTPLQMITAVSAAVNGGKLMQPYVVSQILDAEGNVLSSTEPTVRREVMSKENSKVLVGILERVVGDPDGSGRFAYVPGFRVGGKTGTSEKLDKKENGEVTLRIASFLGIAPSNDPQIAVLIILDEPHMQNIYGSVIAAPVVGAIFADILPYMGIEPQYTQKELEEREVSVPFVRGKMVHDAISDLTAKGLKYKLVGEGVTIVRQLPTSGEIMPKGGKVLLYTTEDIVPEKLVVPDVQSLSYNQANRTLLNARLNVKVQGGEPNETDPVLYQYPAPNEVVDEGTVVHISFKDPIDLSGKPAGTGQSSQVQPEPAQPPATSSSSTAG